MADFYDLRQELDDGVTPALADRGRPDGAGGRCGRVKP